MACWRRPSFTIFNPRPVVGPAIALKVNAGDKVNLETWACYEHKEDYTEDISLMVFSQLLGSTFAYIQGFDAMAVSKATETFQAALPALTGAGVDASQPRAFLNYIVFNSKMESIASDRVQVSEAAGFEPDERAVEDMHGKLAMNISITEPGYIYAWVSNGSENTKVISMRHDGSTSRLNRDTCMKPAVYGSRDYCREELVAEIAACFLCGEAGIYQTIR